MANLKQKSIYTAYSRVLTLVISVLSQLILTPIVLSFLGTTLYGIYTLVNKTNNYLSLVDIRPTAILRLKLAHDQSIEGIDNKNKYVGASLIISLIFTPVFLIAGCVLAYFFPTWFHVEPEYVVVSRVAIILLSIFLAVNGFLGIPEAILRGNNLEYRGFFVEPIRNILVAGFTVLFLYLGWGLLSAVLAMFIAAIFAFVSRKILQTKYLSEYYASRPEKKHIKDFFNKGGWYLVSSVLMQTINNFDIILIGILLNPESVTLFAITKAIVFRVVESVETIVASTTSSIGEIVGGNDVNRIYMVRTRLFKIVIPLALFVTGYFFVFNGAFIDIWTGDDVYAGNTVNLIICISAMFLMLTSTEEIFVQSYLDFKRKTVCLSIAASAAIIISVSLSPAMGLVGNAFGILVGRAILFMSYNYLNTKKVNNKFINFSFLFLLNCIVSIAMIALMFFAYQKLANHSITSFVLGSVFYILVFGGYCYKTLLDKDERSHILKTVSKK